MSYFNARTLGDGAKRVLTFDTIDNLEHKPEVVLTSKSKCKTKIEISGEMAF